MRDDEFDIDAYDPVITAADFLALDAGYVFDRERAMRPIEFIETFCRLKVGKWRGKLMRLLPWQKRWIARVFGWVHSETRFRRFFKAFLLVAKQLRPIRPARRLGLPDAASRIMQTNADRAAFVRLIASKAVGLRRRRAEFDNGLLCPRTVPQPKSSVERRWFSG